MGMRGESLSFKVVPELYLNEPSLQMLNLMLKVAIFIYIIVVSILMNKQYLLLRRILTCALIIFYTGILCCLDRGSCWKGFSS